MEFRSEMERLTESQLSARFHALRAQRATESAVEQRNEARAAVDEARAERDAARKAPTFVVDYTGEAVGVLTRERDAAMKERDKARHERDIARAERDVAKKVLGGNGTVWGFLFDVAQEIQRARQKFPTNAHLCAALTEETGEVARALLDGSPGQRHLREECVQVACVAARIALEGDGDFGAKK